MCNASYSTKLLMSAPTKLSSNLLIAQVLFKNAKGWWMQLFQLGITMATWMNDVPICQLCADRLCLGLGAALVLLPDAHGPCCCHGNGSKLCHSIWACRLQLNISEISGWHSTPGAYCIKLLTGENSGYFLPEFFSCVKVNGRIVLTRVFSFNQSFLR